MGCVLAKPSTSESERRDGSSISGERNETAKTVLIDKTPSVSTDRYHPDDRSHNSLPAISRAVPKSREAEQIVAGWPPWLASVAAEALAGWIPRKPDSFQKLDKIGQGTYSSVYKARDLHHSKLVALKRVRFDNLDPESVKFMAREIIVLRRLDHPNVIKLEGLIASPASSTLYLVFDYMDHDLTGLSSLPQTKFTEPQVKCYMKQLLSGLEHCHSRGILHRDIKGSNLLIDNSGILKIADFGLATFYHPQENITMTSRVVTLWYRPPELLLGAIHYSETVDLWSTGCILGELYSGKPLMPGRTEVEQLHKIFKLCGSPPEEFWIKSKLRHAALFKPHQPYKSRIAERFKDVPASTLQLIEVLLSVDPAFRGTATSALNSEYFSVEPLACDPSSLPKYSPSKEMDVKIREDQKKRRDDLEGRGRGADPARQGPGQCKAAVGDKASADLFASVQMQERKRQSFLASRNQTFNSHMQQSPSNDSSETTREVGKEIFDQLRRRRGLYSGPLTRGAAWPSTRNQVQHPVITPRESEVSTLSTLGVSRAQYAENGRPGPSLYNGPARHQFPGLTNALDQDRLFHSYSSIYSNQNEEMARGARPAINSNKNGYGGSDEHRIHYSGPLMLHPKNVDEMMRERDRRIQEAGRRSRAERPVQLKSATNIVAFPRR